MKLPSPRKRSAYAVTLILPLTIILLSCSDNNAALTADGDGVLWLASQGNTTVQAYTIELANGSLSLNGSASSLGPFNTPVAILSTPNANAIFVCNRGGGVPSTGAGIAAYSVNSDGTLSLSASTSMNGFIPAGMAINPAGTFLFVANQGSFDLSQPGSIFVFAISGTTLNPVPGSPFTTEPAGATNGTGPVSVAVSASGNYLYVANQFSNTVSSFQISSSGALSPLSSNAVGISPSTVFVSTAISSAVGTSSPAGQYLYVANHGSNNISAFAICDAANGTTCASPNGLLTPVAGSPFPAEPGPIAIVMDPTAPFLYVANEQANQISQFSWSSGTGALTPLGTATVSAGGNPVSLAIRAGIAATATVAGTDYLYAANLNASSMSVYSLNTTSGLLNVIGSPVTTPAQPSALTVR